MAGTRLVSWNTMAMPARSASAGVEKETSLPSKLILPSVSLNTPAMTLVRVDLPAPFSPSSAWISPLRRSKSTFLKAGMRENALVAFLSSMMLASDIA